MPHFELQRWLRAQCVFVPQKATAAVVCPCSSCFRGNITEKVPAVATYMSYSSGPSSGHSTDSEATKGPGDGGSPGVAPQDPRPATSDTVPPLCVDAQSEPKQPV